MKKIKLTESQVEQLLNEGAYTDIKNLLKKTGDLLSGEGTIKDPGTLSAMSDTMYDAMKGVGGTKVEDIKSTFLKCKNFHDIKNLFDTFAKEQTNQDLLEWLDSDIDYDDEWKRIVYRPIRIAYQASQKAGHFKEAAEQDETEKNIMSKFPCLKDEKGYKFRRAKNGILYFQNDANVGIKDYGIKMDGSMYYYMDGKWNMAPEKASCKTADYQDIQEQLDYGGIPSEKKTEPKPEGGSEPKPEGGNTGTKEKPAEEKPKVVTKLMTGSDVKEIQTILHKQGFGDIVGSVDGKLGPKTLAGIKQLFLGVTRPKIEAITLKPKDIKPLTTKSEPSTQLAEDIQKNFNRFL